VSMMSINDLNTGVNTAVVLMKSVQDAQRLLAAKNVSVPGSDNLTIKLFNGEAAKLDPVVKNLPNGETVAVGTSLVLHYHGSDRTVQEISAVVNESVHNMTKIDVSQTTQAPHKRLDITFATPMDAFTGLKVLRTIFPEASTTVSANPFDPCLRLRWKPFVIQVNRADRKVGRSLFVTHLSSASTEENIKDHFVSCGPILKVKRLTSAALVEFVYPRDCARALQLMNGTILDGAVITIREDRDCPSLHIREGQKVKLANTRIISS
jgi:hypothetical protein